LPPGAYLDTNLLLHVRDETSSKYQSARACLAELLAQRAELHVSALVFDELWWGLFRLSYRLLTGRPLTGDEYKANIELWKANWLTVRRITAEVLALPGLNVLESASSAALVRDAMALIDANPLAPRDAFHLAITLRHQVPAFVTADSDFDHLRLPGGQDLTIVRL